MPLRNAIRILLSLAIFAFATAGGAHGSVHVESGVVATVQSGSTARAAEGGCTSTGQTHCHLFGVAEDRSLWIYGGEVRAARLFAADDPHRSGSDPHLEEKPPRSLR